MNETETTKLFIDISKNLGEINSKIGTLCETLAKHEQRITNLEQNKFSIKDNIVKWLVIALIGTIGIIATLTGSTAIIKAMLAVG